MASELSCDPPPQQYVETQQHMGVSEESSLVDSLQTGNTSTWFWGHLSGFTPKPISPVNLKRPSEEYREGNGNAL